MSEDIGNRKRAAIAPLQEGIRRSSFLPDLLLRSGFYIFRGGMNLERKYFKELARRLQIDEIATAPPESKRLVVLLKDQPVLFVSAGSDVFQLPAGSNNPDASELYHKVAQTADEVYAYHPESSDWYIGHL